MNDASTELPRPGPAASQPTPEATTGPAGGPTRPAPLANPPLRPISDHTPDDLPPLSPTVALLRLLGLPDHTDTARLAHLLKTLRDLPVGQRADAVRASGLLDQATSPDLAPELMCAVVLRLAAAERVHQWIRELESVQRG